MPIEAKIEREKNWQDLRAEAEHSLGPKQFSQPATGHLRFINISTIIIITLHETYKCDCIDNHLQNYIIVNGIT